MTTVREGLGKNICKVEGCYSNIYGHGLCSKHYQRWKRHGNTEYIPYAERKTHHHMWDMIVTPRQHSVIVGSLLGDGYCGIKRNRQSTNHPYLEIAHSPNQSAWVDYKYQLLENLSTKKPIVVGQIYPVCIFRTYRHKRLWEYRSRFYSNGKKIIPSDIEKDLNPISMAIWYGDDGHVGNNGNNGTICTDSFSVADVQTLSNALITKFGIINHIWIREKKYPRIYISVYSFKDFVNLISSYLPKSMHYKLGVFNPNALAETMCQNIRKDGEIVQTAQKCVEVAEMTTRQTEVWS